MSIIFKFKLKSRNFLRVISLFKFNEKICQLSVVKIKKHVKKANFLHMKFKSKSQWWELFSHPSGIKKLFLVYLTFQILWEKFSNYFTHTHLCVSSRDVFGAGEFFSLSHTHTFQSRRNLHDFSCQNFFTKFEKGVWNFTSEMFQKKISKKKIFKKKFWKKLKKIFN